MSKVAKDLLPTRRGLIAWLVLTVGLLVLNGVLGLVLGAAIGAFLCLAFPARHLALIGAILMLVVPIALIAHGLPTQATVTPQFAHDSVANDFAFCGITLIVVGLVSVGLDRRSVDRGDGEQLDP